MNELPEKNELDGNDGAIDLKTRLKPSHNQALTNERLMQLVKLMARRAAEKDFKAHIAHPQNRGRTDHDTAY